MVRKRQFLSYPRNSEEWCISISQGIGLPPEKGRSLYNSGRFPFDELISWICREFSEENGYSLNFVPALIRNIKGLVNWVYGNGSEPYWSGKDDEE